MSKTLYVVGIGPGTSDWITPAVSAAIADSSDLVGYQVYLDLLGSRCDGRRLHAPPMGEEIERARLALDLAAGGRTTSLISSGDIGIYALAALVFELLERQLKGLENHPDWLETDIQVLPGISAMQAASARAGAMLGHDFCNISLSDLLTPWEVIERRVHAAGAGDFVVNFYNPVSRRRDWQLNKARDILLGYRPETTPVVIGRQLTRPEEEISFTTLAQLDASQVDMFTLVAVGNSDSREISCSKRKWIYTPRGYQKKMS